MCAKLGVIWGLPAMEDEGSALFCLLPPSHTLPHAYYPPPILLTYCPFWFNKLFFFFCDHGNIHSGPCAVFWSCWPSSAAVCFVQIVCALAWLLCIPSWLCLLKGEPAGYTLLGSRACHTHLRLGGPPLLPSISCAPSSASWIPPSSPVLITSSLDRWLPLKVHDDSFWKTAQVSLLSSLSFVRLFATPWTAAHQASLSFTVSRSLLKFMSIELVMPPNHLILCHPLLFLTQSLLASGSFLMSWLFTLPGQSIGASASGSVLPMNIHSELISFRIDWFDLLAVQRTLKRLLQHHSWKASILQCSAFLMVQLIYLYTTTGKTVALTIWTFVGKLMSLLFNTLSRFVIAFLPRSKCLLISWLQSPSAVILEPKKIKSVTQEDLFSFLSTRLLISWV